MSRSQKQKLANLKATNARRHLRNLEIEAYASAVNVFRAQGVLTKDKLDVLENLGKQLDIPIERHYAELRRALSDYDLNKTAETLIGFDPSSSWYEEAQKFAENFQPFIPKARFTTNAFRAISNYCTNQMLRDLLPCEENGKNITELNTGDTNDKSDHSYHNRIHPLAAKILAEWGADLEEPGALSRSYLTPVGLEELTDVFPDQNDFADLENPPLSPSEDVTIENYMLTSGMRRGTEPKTLSTKRRRCTSEHKSQTAEDTPSYESRRSSDKNTPSNLSKIMQDYQLIMSLTKKKKVDQPEASTDRRRKGKKVESVTQESPIQVPDSKNRSGLIVPCISIERMPLSQPKPRTPSPGKKISTTTTPTVLPSPKKPNIKRMKKKQLSQTTSDPIPTAPKSPLKRRVRLKRISVVVSPNKVTDSQKTLDNSQTPSLSQPIQTQSVTQSTQYITEHSNIHEPEPMEDVAVLLTTGTIDIHIDNTQELEGKPDADNSESFVSDMPIASYGNHQADKTADTQEPSVVEAAAHILKSTYPEDPEEIRTPEQTETTLITEQIVSEQVLVRRKKDSNTSLDIPSPDKIRNEMQSLYSPISSLDTPPDLDRAGHFELVSESVPLLEGKTSHPIFSPITSPEDSQSPDKQVHTLVAQSAERLSLVLQEPSIDVLPQKCSLALSDIVEEVCDSISDPLSPSLTFSRDESKPYTSPDSVFTDSSLMLSKALNSFMMSQGISEENVVPRPAAQEHISDTTTELSDLISTQVLPAVEDFAQISASLLSMDQLTTESNTQPTQKSDSTNS